MKRCRFIAYSVIFSAMLLSGCKNHKDNVAADPTIENLPESTLEISSSAQVEPEIFDKYQGEWSLKSNKKADLIISESSVNFISYDILERSDNVEKIYTFYLQKDDDGNIIIVNSHKQNVYSISLSDEEILTITDIGTKNNERTYSKISDNTTIPTIKTDPYIGMPESIVESSSWGIPKKKNRTESTNGTTEQWIYDRGYIYITNGFVTTIQTK